ncbi:MAG: tetraacyldisaccharide 4'-kinase [Parabacteroides sp.]
MAQPERTLYPALLPLSYLYGWGVKLRDKCFRWGWLPSERYPIPVICIGNLAVGGTGKTPHTEYLIRLLETDYRVAVLSRGYKRKSSGFLLATEQHTSRDIGDEPYQIKQKFPHILVAVDADRRNGMRRLLNLPAGQRPQVVLLDDAFQHRYVTPSLSILLTDHQRPYFQDKLLPCGRLREPKEAAHRADIVIVTKCPPEMSPLEYRILEENLHLQAHQTLFFSHVVYHEMQPLFPDRAPARSLSRLTGQEEVVLIVGIASPTPFMQEIRRHTERIHPVLFADHHDFRQADIERIQQTLRSVGSAHPLLLTTEKDAARLRHNPLLPEAWKKILYYLPIQIRFNQERTAQFDQIIQKHIQLFYEQQNRNSQFG